MEKIEVRIKEVITWDVQGVAYAAYHAYILYTDSNGNVYYARGGFDEDTGNIDTDHGPYVDGTDDYKDPNDDEPQEIATGEDLSAEWQSIKDTMDAIKASNTPYDAVFQNSNSVVSTALSEAGLPPFDFPDSFTPGSDYPLDLAGPAYSPPPRSSITKSSLGSGGFLWPS